MKYTAINCNFQIYFINKCKTYKNSLNIHKNISIVKKKFSEIRLDGYTLLKYFWRANFAQSRGQREGRMSYGMLIKINYSLKWKKICQIKSVMCCELWKHIKCEFGSKTLSNLGFSWENRKQMDRSGSPTSSRVSEYYFYACNYY